MALLEVRELSRRYRVRDRRRGVLGAVLDLFSGEHHYVDALRGVSFDLEPGEIVGYIGPNGAGKSTTIKCVTGILKPSTGTVRLKGLDPWSDRNRHVRNLGVVFGQRTQLWWDLAVWEAFDLLASVFSVPDDTYEERLDELVELLGLEPLLSKPVRQLSLGQRVRCDLAAALIHAPPLVLLDEPTIGLDVAVKLKIREFVKEMARERGVAVLLTTHDLGDVEKLCDRVMLLHEGAIVYRGSLDGLREEVDAFRRVEVELSDFVTDALLEPLSDLAVERTSETTLSVRIGHDVRAAAVVQRLMEGLPVEDLAIHEPSAEDLVSGFYEERA